MGKKILDPNFGKLIGKKILLADHDLISQKVISLSFRDTGAEFTIVNNGREAVIKILEELKFDLVMLRLHMPVMNGDEAFEYIRELKPSLPIFVYGNFTEKYSIDFFYRSGAYFCFNFPFQANELIENVLKSV